MFRRQLTKVTLVAVVAALPHPDTGYVSLLQHMTTKMSSMSGNVNVGSSATIDETGYEEVVEAGKLAQSQEIMYEFAKRLCKSDGLRITNQTEFAEFLKYFDGSCATQSFDALVMGLHDAVHKPDGCGGGWVMEEDDLENPDQSDNGQEAGGFSSLLAVRAVSSEKARMHTKLPWIFRSLQDLRGKQSHTLAKTGNPTSNNVPKPDQKQATDAQHHQMSLKQQGEAADLQNEQQEATDSQNQQQAAADLQNQQQAADDSADSLNSQNQTAAEKVEHVSLDESGYQSIAKDKNNALMVAFIQKFLKSEGLKATDERKIEHMAPWYTSQCGPQSLGNLRKELHHSMKQSNGTEGSWSTCGGWVDFL